VSRSPDFAAMLAAITDRAELAVASKRARASLATATWPGNIQIVPADCSAAEEASTDISIANAVTDACIGMADRRLMCGDTTDAEVWREIAAEGD